MGSWKLEVDKGMMQIDSPLPTSHSPLALLHCLVLAAAIFGIASPLSAQIMRLPPTIIVEDDRPANMVPPDIPLAVSPPAGPVGPPSPPDDPDMPRDVRPGVFQKLLFDGTWLARGGDQGFGMTDLELRTVLGFPFPTRSSPLIVTPGFAAHLLDGPAGVDLPPRVYDAYTEFRWMRRLWPRLGVDVAVSPGVYSDFQTSKDAIRITGHGVGAWTCSPTTMIVLGATYLDRRDVAVLPVAGIIWKPDEDSKFELVFPKPKIAHRIYWTWLPPDQVEDWVYVAGELGGGIWAFQHASGADDVFSYRDYRVMLGIERKVFGGLGTRVEVGYVFGRKIELTSTSADIFPSDTVMLRGGLMY